MSYEHPRVTIAELFEEQREELQMRLVAGEAGLSRYVDNPRMQKPSLAFAGFPRNLNDYRLQVIGKTELEYLATKPPEEQRRVVDAVFDLRVAAVVVTRGLTPPDIIVAAAQRTDTPLLISELRSSTFMTDMTQFLARRLAPIAYQHGVYMDIFGLGVLITGGSGLGKSEIGLELISRGHRLIADDMVELVRESPAHLVGRSPESLRYHMEIRGLGVLNIRDLYGAAALTDVKRVGIVVELLQLENTREIDRLQVDERTTTLHGVKVPHVTLPIRPGRSIAVLVEVATRNQLLRMRGIDSSRDFMERLHERIRKGQV